MGADKERETNGKRVVAHWHSLLKARWPCKCACLCKMKEIELSFYVWGHASLVFYVLFFVEEHLLDVVNAVKLCDATFT